MVRSYTAIVLKYGGYQNTATQKWQTSQYQDAGKNPDIQTACFHARSPKAGGTYMVAFRKLSCWEILI